MKENLFSRATQSTVERRLFKSVFFKLILLPLLCIPLLYGAHDFLYTVPPQEPQVVVFVSSNATVYGVSSISNAKIVALHTEVSASKAAEPKMQPVTLQKQIAASRNKEKKALKKLQQEIDRRVKSQSYSNSSDNQLMSLAKITGATQATSTGFFFKFQKAALSGDYRIPIFSVHDPRQKIITSFSDIQSDKLLLSFLRGPPLKTPG
ncbi:hypothetical protein KSK37_06290 [Kaistella sp. DKR-2]|uniref:hypothetical protein n=1 Tax=Kaistella soli TaxID=2849654 RepID=UPI001C27A200|nr:hypothetical protein [Kaistella soli]MBU8882687.1 hypothetical protein [Kaistella soli]